jgi:thiamine kinase-like enzyme
MTRALPVEAALRRIPGWESASWMPIDGGLTNRVWLVESGGRKGLLKVDGQVRGIPFVNRLQEARIQDTAAAEGLANRVFFANETTLLTEYVDGTVWSARQFNDDENLARLARALKCLHALPPVGRRFDAVAAAEKYSGNIGNADPLRAQQCMRTIRSFAAPEQVRCCHNDLVAENILDSGGIRFLDWEYAADNDPLFDLATVVAHHGLDSRQAGILLDAYFDGYGARKRSQFAEHVRLYEALCWLWEAAQRR